MKKTVSDANNNAKSKTNDIVEKVKNVVEPIVKSLNLILWNVEFYKTGKDWTLAVIVDKENSYIDIDDCVSIHNQIDPMLDKYDFIASSYSLEISSPGINRELKTDEHILKYISKPVCAKLYLKDEVLKTKEVKGTLLSFNSFNDNILKIEVKNHVNDNNITNIDIGTTKIFEYEKKLIAHIYADDEANV